MNNPPKKPKNPYFLFIEENTEEIKKKHEGKTFKELRTIMTEMY